MDTGFLDAFALDLGDGLDRGTDRGPDALLPVLYANAYDGVKRRYEHFGEAVLARREGHGLL